MTMYQTNAGGLQLPSTRKPFALFTVLRSIFEARRKRHAEKLEIERVRRLEPYLLRDAGIDSSVLFSALARIAEARIGQ